MINYINNKLSYRILIIVVVAEIALYFLNIPAIYRLLCSVTLTAFLIVSNLRWRNSIPEEARWKPDEKPVKKLNYVLLVACVVVVVASYFFPISATIRLILTTLASISLMVLFKFRDSDRGNDNDTDGNVIIVDPVPAGVDYRQPTVYA